MDSILLANYVIREYNKKFFITRLTLHKILYIIQNRLLRADFSGKNIIEDKFVAREEGPIIKRVYEKFKWNFTVYSFLSDEYVDFFIKSIPFQVRYIIDSVITEFMFVPPWELVDLIHDPYFAWSRTKRNQVIPNEDIVRDLL